MAGLLSGAVTSRSSTTAWARRRNRRLAVLRSDVRHDDGRLLLATAIGSYTIFPRKRVEA